MMIKMIGVFQLGGRWRKISIKTRRCIQLGDFVPVVSPMYNHFVIISDDIIENSLQLLESIKWRLDRRIYSIMDS